MTVLSNQDLAGLIARYAREPVLRKQLARLPGFAVPSDTDMAFRNLLARLHQADARSDLREPTAAP